MLRSDSSASLENGQFRSFHLRSLAMNLINRFGGRIWNPWQEIGQIQHEVSRLLAGANSRDRFMQREFPSVNLFVKEHDLLLTLELAGIDPANIDVSVAGDTVTIRGDRPTEAIQPGANF